MSKYKIHIDKPLPDPNRIAKYKDFESLQQQYQVRNRFEFWRNLYRKPQYFAGIVGIIAVLFLIVDSLDISESAPLVEAPIEVLDVPFMQQELLAEQGGSIVIGDEKQIIIPADAFVSQSEQSSITGPIQLEVRELSDPTDLFLSGVAMNDDSMAHLEGLQNLVLLDIRARQDGKRIQLQKSIEVVYLSRDTSTAYQVYQLDTVSRSWTVKGKDQVELLRFAPDSNQLPPRPQRPALLALRDNDADTMIARAARPFPQRPGKPFGVKVKNLSDYPEFRGFDKVYWEYVAMNGSANPWEEGLIGEGQGWEDVRIQQMRTRNGFELTFGRQGAEGNIEFRKVIARPMFEAKTQAEADLIYQDRLQAFQTAMAEIQQERAARQDQERKLAEAEQSYQESIANWEAAKSDSSYACYRRFSLDQLGIASLSQPLNLTHPSELKIIQFEEKLADEKTNQIFYLALPQINSLLMLRTDTEGRLLVPTSTQAYLWTADAEAEQIWTSSLLSLDGEESSESTNIVFRPLPESQSSEEAKKLLESIWINGQKMKQNLL